MASFFLVGDVMTGRGIDQILPFPDEPDLYEDSASSALDYVGIKASLRPGAASSCRHSGLG